MAAPASSARTPTKARPRAGRRSTTSSMAMWPRSRSTQGAPRKVTAYSMYSVASSDQGSVNTRRLRAATSTTTSAVSSTISAPATIASASIRTSNQERDRAAPPRTPPSLLRQKRPDLADELRIALGQHLPVELLGLLREAGAQVHVLDAGLVLHRLLLAVLLRAPLGPLALDPLRHAREAGALLVVERLPLVLVDEDRDRRADEARAVAVLGVLVPAEVGDAVQRPAVAVHRAA